MLWPWSLAVLFVELVSKLFRLLLNAICMGFREFREISDGEWEVVRSFLPPMSSVGRLGLMIGWS
jgi:hypothetical protein